jgi:hypothetical protein
MSTSPSPTRSFWGACRQPAVWKRAARLGLAVGIIQVAINQGDHWFRQEITPVLILKTILSPLLSFSIAFASAVATQLDRSPGTTLSHHE